MSTTDFGFEQVSTAEKSRRVREVFESVASKYDLMNDLMSLGMHRLWKRYALAQSGLRPGQRALDVAGGTGDLAAAAWSLVGEQGFVALTDINAPMLREGRDKLLNRGAANVAVLQADAEHLPFRDASFHCAMIGFGLRNVTDKEAALKSMKRVLKPGGRLVILEFSRLVLRFLQPLYDVYSFRLLPALGDLVAHDAASYRYLAESIRVHPDQDTLLAMMGEAGLEDCRYHNLSGGIVAVHVGHTY